MKDTAIMQQPITDELIINDNTNEAIEKFLSLKNFLSSPRYSDAFTQSSMRHLIFNSESKYSASGEEIPGNGLKQSGALLRIGSKILINTAKFDAWLIQYSKLSEQ